MQLIRPLLCLPLFALAISGCDVKEGSEAEQDATTPSAGNEATVSAAGDEDVDLLAPTNSESPTPPPAPKCERSAYCAGALLVRSDRLVLSNPDQGDATVRGTLSFENTSNQDLRIALLPEELVLNLDNGSKVRTGRPSRDTSGLGVCRDSGPDCFNTSPDTFRLISPGDSPSKLNVELHGRYDPSLAPTMSQIEKGTLTLTAFTVAADGSRRQRRISLSDIPVTNQIAR